MAKKKRRPTKVNVNSFNKQNDPEEFCTGYKLHHPARTCFYCMGERATIVIDKKKYPPLGADGATVVINNTLHL